MFNDEKWEHLKELILSKLHLHTKLVFQQLSTCHVLTLSYADFYIRVLNWIHSLVCLFLGLVRMSTRLLTYRLWTGRWKASVSCCVPRSSVAAGRRGTAPPQLSGSSCVYTDVVLANPATCHPTRSVFQGSSVDGVITSPANKAVCLSIYLHPTAVQHGSLPVCYSLSLTLPLINKHFLWADKIGLLHSKG